jgi:hypothetical protein
MGKLAQRAAAALEAQEAVFLTPQEVVERLHLRSIQAAARLADKGMLECERIRGNLRQYKLSSVIKYEEAQGASADVRPGKCKRSH